MSDIYRKPSIPVDINSDGSEKKWGLMGIGITKNAYASKKPLVITVPCPHKVDGAIEVAKYIVEEIKTNIKSGTAKSLRYLNHNLWG